jgi:hypothetical protein
MPAVEKSLGNSKPEAATMATVLQKRRRNSSCAVAALPSELLSIVFSMNVLSDRPGQKNGKHNLGWISATQVCHRWREVCAATHRPGFLVCVHSLRSASDRARNVDPLEISRLCLYVS